nr:uncharacterized protein LOC109409203 [Aedes albopictus]
MDARRSEAEGNPNSQDDCREDYDNDAVGKFVRIVPKKRKSKEVPVPSPACKIPRTKGKHTKSNKCTVAGSAAEISKIEAKLAAVVRDLEIERSRSSALAEQLKQVQEGNCSSKDSVDSMATGSAAGQNFYAGAGPSSTRRAEQLSALEGTRFVSSINQLLVSSVNIPECKAPEGEELQRHSFEMWKEMLQDSMSLAGDQDEKIKYTVFKLKAGPKLLDIFRNTKSDQGAPNAEELPYSNAMHRLKAYFGSGSDVMLQRRKLALMTQLEGETDLNFISRVGTTARHCDFGEEKEFDEIVATVAGHARSKEVRVTALQMLNSGGTLTDLIDKIRHIEAVRINEEYYEQKHGKQEPVVIAQNVGFKQQDQRGAHSVRVNVVQTSNRLREAKLVVTIVPWLRTCLLANGAGGAPVFITRRPNVQQKIRCAGTAVELATFKGCASPFQPFHQRQHNHQCQRNNRVFRPWRKVMAMSNQRMTGSLGRNTLSLVLTKPSPSMYPPARPKKKSARITSH